MFVLSLTQMKAFTRWLVGMFATIGGLMQIDFVNKPVTKLLTTHPKIAPGVGAIIAIGLAIHDPRVQRLIGFRQTKQTDVKPDGTVVKETTTTEVSQVGGPAPTPPETL